MKKLIGLLLTSVMVITLAIPASAASTMSAGKQQRVNVNDYSFEISVYEDENHVVTKTYTRPQNERKASNTIPETKALLSALGMSEARINKLSVSTLEKFGNSEEIAITSAYTKRNENSNELTYLTKAEAEREAAELSGLQEEYISRLTSEETHGTRGYKPNDSNVPGVFEDSYMYITHTVAREGTESYFFTTSAQWLTMPYFRGKDSIGSCAMDCTVTPNTASGEYSYGVQIVQYGESYYDTVEGSISDIRTKTSDGWHGVAGLIDLPNDVISTNTTSRYYRNYTAYIEYSGHISSPSEIRWFNSVGTYDHSTVTLNVNPGISIDFSGNVAASIGLSIQHSKDTRCAEVEMRHTP